MQEAQEIQKAANANAAFFKKVKAYATEHGVTEVDAFNVVAATPHGAALIDAALAASAKTSMPVVLCKSADTNLDRLEQQLDANEERLRKAGYYDTPYDKLEKGLVKFCKSQSIAAVWTDGLDAFGETPEGAALVAAQKAVDASQSTFDGDTRNTTAVEQAPDTAYNELQGKLETFCQKRGIANVWNEGLDLFVAESDENRELVERAR